MWIWIHFGPFFPPCIVKSQWYHGNNIIFQVHPVKSIRTWNIWIINRLFGFYNFTSGAKHKKVIKKWQPLFIPSISIMIVISEFPGMICIVICHKRIIPVHGILEDLYLRSYRRK